MDQEDIALSEKEWQMKNSTEFVSWEIKGVKRSPKLEITDQESSEE